MQSSSTLGFLREFNAIRLSHKDLVGYHEPSAILDALHRGSGDHEAKNRILVSLGAVDVHLSSIKVAANEMKAVKL